MVWTAAFWATLAIAFAAATVRCLTPHEPLRFVVAPAVPDRDDGAAPFYREEFLPLPEETPEVHSSTLTELPNGDILAAWYGGQKELAEDVAIYASTMNQATGQWSTPRVLVNSEGTEDDVEREIKTVGNPVLYTDAKGKTWLFFATVSMGGWSGAAINVKTSDDGGQTWTPGRRLVLSPLLNMATMVRTPALSYGDGSIGLPTYHQGISKFPELVHLSPAGDVLSKVRMEQARAALQPSIVPLSPTDAVALLRNMYGGITEITTHNAGESWSPSVRLDLPAPNSSLMAVRLPDGRLMLAFNNSTHRTNLSLALSEDGGQTWKVVHEFTEGKGAFSYPCLLLTSKGVVHLTYTWDRLRIKHIVFNLAWLRAQS
jgi:predicted neuraminidase